MKSITIEGFVAKIGQNAKENWELLDESEKDYWFFHLTSFPSGYVIWHYEGDIPSDEVLRQLAKACLANTKYRRMKNVKVDYTRCGNLRKTDKVGEVEYVSKRKVNTVKLVPEVSLVQKAFRTI